MPKGKDLTHLGREMERAWDERRSRSSSPVSRPALPRGRSRSPVATRFTRVRQSIDVEYEWSVLWSGAEKMYHATSATNRNAGWQRFESAAEILRRHMADLTTAAQAVPKTEDIAAELVRQLNQSQSPPCDPVEIARTVAGMMTARPRTPPVINMAELARLISENLKIERAPPYSPIVDVTRITNLVEERLEAKQKAAAQHPTSLSETAEVSELTADLPPLRLSTSSTSEDESTTVVQPATITPIEQSTSTSTTRPAATAKASRKSDRRCLACGKARAHNSRLWCEACRMFLVRAKKAAETDKPYTCVVTSHNNKPDTTNCRGCRLQCDCDTRGSSNQTCNPEGQCYCKPEIEGKKCDKCRNGFYYYPECTVLTTTKIPVMTMRSTARTRCSPGEFTCKKMNWEYGDIPCSFVCDGVIDCIDGTDEVDC
ncbi:hypothetical protein GE061_006787 [Apolygus lucorum]|uniref:Uncharacterized protein n=1 Tax=Apolygus lucorum TaxID=248454 RepID=A0A6A4J909_APOLU|nr:hypothetical protein GE061_006787 [Apolygus lucorum]